jgi:type IV pilus assembly protein PilC
MSEFVVRVGTPDGLVLEQRHHAPTLESLRRELEGKGLHVFRITPARRGLSLPFLRRREHISSLDFLAFNQQLATLLAAGIPVLQSLELLQRAQSDSFMRQMLARVLEEVKSGAALSEAFAAQGKTFPRLYSASLMAGERSGELVQVLERYVRYQEMMEGVRRKVTSALTYPAVLLSLAFGLVALLVTYVIPRFASFYVGFAAELPLITQIIVESSHWLQRHLVYVAGGALLGALAMRRWLRSERGGITWDRWRLRWPFLGEVFHLFALSQFVRSLATLVAGGTPLVNAIEIAVSTVTNRFVHKVLLRVAPRVREGQALWTSLQQTQLFPDLSLAMVQVGEATGALEGMLFNVSRFYDETIEARLARIVTLVEPAVLVLMGVIISGLLLSVYMPMFTLIQRVQ